VLENELKHPKHLLIMRLSAIGDVAMTVPVVLALRQQYPKLKITIVSRPLFKSFFAFIPDIHFYAADVENSQTGIRGLYKLYKDLSVLGIDAFADLHNVLRSKVIATFFKWNKTPVISLNKDRTQRKKLTALKPKILSPMKSMIDRHAEVCKKLHLPIDLSEIKLIDSQPMSTEIERITGKKNSKWIGIAPFATYETKMYPLSLMKEVIQLLLQDEVKVFLFGGGKNEVEQLKSMASVSSNCVNIAGTLTFQQELDLISNLDLMLSMDSGNGHMAAMFGVSVITMWGNTHPFAGFVPFRQPIENSLLPDMEKYPFLPTSVYGNKIVPGYTDCMKTIQPEVVVKKINQLLAQSITEKQKK
jgi:ADP-heptose:LPS heptosyltransferase